MPSDDSELTNPLNTYWGAGTIVVVGLVYAAATANWWMLAAAVLSVVGMALKYYVDRRTDEDRDLRNVYCPHCGAFIPRYFRPLTSWEATEVSVRAPERFKKSRAVSRVRRPVGRRRSPGRGGNRWSVNKTHQEHSVSS